VRRLATATRAGSARLQAREQPSRDRRAQWLLDLQRTSGNAAVTRLVQRAPNDRPASTDVADTASAGPKTDIHARVIGVSVVNKRTRITIASGTDQGIEVGMKGAITDSSGVPFEGFTIEEAEGRLSYATVQPTVDEVNTHSKVVIGPSVEKLGEQRATADVHARVLGVSVVGGRTRILIGRGRYQGVQVGMAGALLRPGGAEGEDFTIEEAEHRWSYAFVGATVDEAEHSVGVVIKAASSASAGMDDKQF